MIDAPGIRVAKRGRNYSWLYVLPLAHFCACLWIKSADLAWMPIAEVDFPVSGLLLGLAWRFGYPMFWFGVVGTLWWCLLVLTFQLFREANRKRR